MRLGKPVQYDVSCYADKQVKMYSYISLHTDIKQDVCFYENTSVQKPANENMRMCLCNYLGNQL